MSYTKGPWRIVEQDIFGNELNGYICTWSGKLDNAKLIKAAPDMVEALEGVLACLVEQSVVFRGVYQGTIYTVGGDIETAVRNAQKAIAKAKRGQA